MPARKQNKPEDHKNKRSQIHSPDHIRFCLLSFFSPAIQHDAIRDKDRDKINKIKEWLLVCKTFCSQIIKNSRYCRRTLPYKMDSDQSDHQNDPCHLPLCLFVKTVCVLSYPDDDLRQ